MSLVKKFIAIYTLRLRTDKSKNLLTIITVTIIIKTLVVI